MFRFLTHLVINVGLIYLLSFILPITITSWVGVVIFLIILSIFNWLIIPIVKLITFPINFITFGLFNLILTLVVTNLAISASRSIIINADGFNYVGIVAIITVALSLGNSLVSSLNK
jgi:putative membrane protein